METVIVLDDSQDVLTSMIALLGSHLPDVEVYTFLEPNEKFYEQCKTANVIIIDIRLNGESGIEVAHKVCDAGGKPVMLFISGYDINDGMFKELDNYCLYDFMPKPCSNYIFTNRVKILLRAAAVYKLQYKQTEELLQESDELHRLMFSNLSDAVFLTDDTGAFTFICPNVDVIFGYSEEEVRTLDNISKLLGDNYYDPNELEALGEIKNIEVKITDKADKKHDLLVNVKGVSIKRGTKLITCRDITERKKLIDTFWNIFNYINFIVIILDRDMNILVGNYYLAHILGFEKEEDLIGKSWLDFIVESDKKIIQYMHKEIEENTDYFHEHINDIISLDGKIIPVRWFNSKTNHESTGTFSIGIPITQEIDPEATIESLRAYWRDIINKDKTTIQIMKKVFADQLKA